MSNRFQILDKEGNAIPLSQLDKEAAEFWNKKYHKKWYANPSPEGTSVFEEVGNWYDIIGWAIANKRGSVSSWYNVVVYLIAIPLGLRFINKNEDFIELIKFEKSGEKSLSLPEEVEINIYCCLEYYRPYIELIKHWMLKGYKPKQIKE